MKYIIKTRSGSVYLLAGGSIRRINAGAEGISGRYFGAMPEPGTKICIWKSKAYEPGKLQEYAITSPVIEVSEVRL